MKSIKIAYVSSEVAPFSKTGGLADVSRSLPKALTRLGHKVIVITPFYGQIIDAVEHELKLVFSDIEIKLNEKETIKVNFWQGSLMNSLPVYFIENYKYFSKRKQLYGSSHDNARFYIFDMASLQLLELLKFNPDIIHCHDWHAGLIPYFLKNKIYNNSALSKAKIVYTIHNLAFQLGQSWFKVPVAKKDFGKKKLPYLSDPDLEYVNFAKRAILNADVINTVSEQYREEVMTKSFGQDLHRILKNREKKLFGIVNGIDYHVYNPTQDRGLFKNYDYKNIVAKQENKVYLQKKVGLPINSKIPIISATSRVTFQKGVDLILKSLDALAQLNAQVIIIGDGDKKYIKEFKRFNKKYPDKFIWLPFAENAHLETLIYAGSDIFVLPSHYEPCGINQLIAMRYGAIPIVRRVGGLQDTVEEYRPENKSGNGFHFTNFNSLSLLAAIIGAMESYQHKDAWQSLVVRAMKQSSSWEIPAKKYVTLYQKVLKEK